MGGALVTGVQAGVLPIYRRGAGRQGRKSCAISRRQGSALRLFRWSDNEGYGWQGESESRQRIAEEGAGVTLFCCARHRNLLDARAFNRGVYAHFLVRFVRDEARAEDRGVGKEGGSTCRSRLAPNPEKKK